MVIISDLAVEAEHHDGSVALLDESHFQKFTQTCGLPTWSYLAGDLTIEKSIVIPSHHNIVHATFSLQSGADRVRLRLRPMVHFRAGRKSRWTCRFKIPIR
jgi:hypothetical protein